MNYIDIKNMIKVLRLDLPSSPNALKQSFKNFNITLSTDEESRIVMTYQDLLKYYLSIDPNQLLLNLQQCKININEIPDYFQIIPNYLNRDPFDNSNTSLSVSSDQSNHIPDPIPSKPIEQPHLDENDSFDEDFEDKHEDEVVKEEEEKIDNNNNNNNDNNDDTFGDFEKEEEENDDEDEDNEEKNDIEIKKEEVEEVEENEKGEEDENRQNNENSEEINQKQQQQNHMPQQINFKNYKNEIKEEESFKYFSHIDPLAQYKSNQSLDSSSDSSEIESPPYPLRNQRGIGEDIKAKPTSINSQPITYSSYGSAKPTYTPSDDVSSEATLRSIPPPNMINDSLPFPMIECPSFVLDCECQLKVQLSTDPNLFGLFHRMFPVSNAILEKAEILRKALQLTSCTMRKEKCQLIIQELEKYDLSKYRSIDQYIFDELNGFRPTLAEDCDLKLSNPNYTKLSEILSYFYRDKVKSSTNRSCSRMSKRMSLGNTNTNTNTNIKGVSKPLKTSRSVSTPKYYQYEPLSKKINITSLTCEGDELTMEKYRKDYRQQHDSIMTIKLLKEGLDLCGIEFKKDKEYDQYLYYITCALNNIKFDYNGVYQNNLSCLQFLSYVKRIAFNTNTSKDELHKITDLEKMYSPEKLMPDSVKARNILRKNLCPGKKISKPIDYDVTDMYDFESELVSIFNRDFDKFIKFRQVFISDKTQRYIITLINKGLLCIGVRPIKSKNSKSIPLAPIILEIIRKLKINKDENLNEKNFVIEELEKEEVIEKSKYEAIYYLIMNIFLNRNTKFITAEYIKYFFIKKVKYELTSVESFDLLTIRNDFKKILKVSLYTQSMKNILCSRFMKGIKTIHYKCELINCKQYIQFLTEVQHIVALDDFIKHITKRIRKVKHYTKPLDFDIEKQQIMEEILDGKLLRENMINPYECIIKYYDIPEKYLYSEILFQTMQYMLTSASVKIIEKLQNEKKSKFRATKEAFQWRKKNYILEILENLRRDGSILVPIYLGFRRMITSGNSENIDSYFNSRIDILKGKAIQSKYLRQIDLDILDGEKSLEEYRKSIINSIENPKGSRNNRTEENDDYDDDKDKEEKEKEEGSELEDDFDNDENEDGGGEIKKEKKKEEKEEIIDKNDDDEETDNYSGVWSEEEQDRMETEKEEKRKQKAKEYKERKALKQQQEADRKKEEEEMNKKEKEKEVRKAIKVMVKRNKPYIPEYKKIEMEKKKENENFVKEKNKRGEIIKSVYIFILYFK